MKIEELKGKTVESARQDGDVTVISFTDGSCFVSAPVEGRPLTRKVVKALTPTTQIRSLRGMADRVL